MPKPFAITTFIWGLRVTYFVLVLSYAVTWPLRLIWFRPRPVPQAHGSLLQRIDASSFPSLHAVRGTAFWTLIAAVTWNPGVAAICALNVVLIAWTRTWLKRHHPSDVAVGMVLGVFVVLIVLWCQDVWTKIGNAVGL